MLDSIRIQRNKYFFIFGWIALWLLPWGEWCSYEGNFPLTILLDVLCLSLAVGLFTLPGIFLFLLLAAPKNFLGSLALIPIGFTFSTLLFGIIGLIGRILGLSFECIKVIFALIGLVELLILILFRPDFLQQKYELINRIRNFVKNYPLLGALIIGNVMLLNGALFFVDDWTYLAYLTNWQRSTSLNFNEVIYGVSASDAARFWLAVYPMGQALLSELSNVSGILLLGNYLEFFLVSIAICSMYFFVRTLGLSKQAAGFSVLAHTALLCWLVWPEQTSAGMWFFQSMSEDKVSAAYIFAPVLFSFLIYNFREPSFRNFSLLFLVGLSIVITHPVILFFCVCIISGLAIIMFLTRKISWSNLVKLFLISIIWMLPIIAIRYSGHPSMDAVPYDAKTAEKSHNIENLINITEDGLFSAPVHILKFSDIKVDPAQSSGYQIFRYIPLMILFGAGLIGLLNLNRDYVYAYLFVSVVLIVLAITPYTGWLLGYFVSARMMPRISWFAPLGMGLVIIVKTCFDLMRPRIIMMPKPSWWSERITKDIYLRIPLWGFVFLLMFGLGSPAMVGVARGLPELINILDLHRQLDQVGAYISNHNSEKVAVITLNALDDYLPGISSSAKPITFRGELKYEVEYFLTHQEHAERQEDSKNVQSLETDIPLDDRLEIIEKYEIKYILADMQQVDTYQKIMNQNNPLIETVYQTNDFALFLVNTREDLNSENSQ